MKVMNEMIRKKFIRQLVIREERKWQDLNTDCLVHIFERVGLESLILHLPLVCKSWYKASLDPQCWKILDFQHLNLEKSFYSVAFADGKVPLVCRTTRAIMFAVKHRCGRATKVVFPFFIHEYIVQYVLERCAALKSLILPEVSRIAHLECVPKLINKWKDLESLTLPDDYYFEEVLAQIRAHCNNFVSLTVKDAIGISKEVVSAIVTFVPNIKHLVLNSCDLHRENLILILSGCRELELLDVTDCKGFDAEILTMASHIKTFMSEGSYVKEEKDYGCDSCYLEEYGSEDSYYHDNHFNYTSEGSSMEAEEEYGFDFLWHDG